MIPDPVPAFPRDLRARIMAVALVPMFFSVTLLAGYFAHREFRATEDARIERGRALVLRLAETAAFDLFAGNDEYLRRLLDYERAALECESIGIADRSGHWRLISGSETLPAPDDLASAREWREGRRMFFSRPVAIHKPRLDDPYLTYDGDPEGALIGQVVVALDMTPIMQSQRDSMALVGGLAGLLLLVSGWLGWRLSQGLSQPLRSVIGTVRELASGRLNARAREGSEGEIGELERGVNRMAEVMQAHALEMEHRVDEATTELRAQKTAAEAAMMARSRFLAAASHDLRQPMHALTLLVEALKEKIRPQAGEPLRLVEHIEASAHAMESLLNALLDISKLDAGVVVARLECFVVAPMLERLGRQFGPLAAEKRLALHIHPSQVAVFTDPVLLERILSNLIANAIRYTQHGRVVVGLRRVQKDWVRFEVLDTGPGIPEDFRERIFEEYFQLENPERDRDKGLGLGLAIVQRLTRLLGSPVEVESTVGRGSAFKIRAVRCEPPVAKVEDTQPGTSTPGLLGNRGQPPLVVFIDDDEAILEAMAAVFDQWGIDLAAGFDAQQIKDDLFELGRRPDAILCDYRLRDGRTGIEAIQELRSVFGPGIPAALITGDTATTTIQAIDATGLPVLHKPLKPAMLRAYLSHMLSLAQPGDPPASP